MNPKDRKYSQDHEWVKLEGDLAVIGITDYAQDQLGDVVYVELPDVGTHLAQFEVFGVIESVKTASDLYAPISGEIVEINQAVVDDPAQVNDAPYDAGWLLKVRPTDSDALQRELAELMEAEAYERDVTD